jgi:thiopeptide-type bacteriocin biosynthesis protein
LINKFIDKWFFIRYVDTEHHLRIRFHIINYDFNTIISKTNKYISPCITSNYISNITFDTYKREIERYGKNNIEIVENLFFNDSNAIIKIISQFETINAETDRWKLGLLLTDLLLTDFKYDLNKKFEILSKMKDAYFIEFNGNKLLKKQLAEKYRQMRENVSSIFKNNNELNNYKQIIANRTKENKKSILKLKQITSIPAINDLIFSFLHMQNNRLFITHQRLHELVIYDFLCQYYRTEIEKKNIK